jgi:hypothetical protein
LVSLSVLLKVYHKNSVSFETVQNFEISDLAMAKVEKVNIEDIQRQTFKIQSLSLASLFSLVKYLQRRH